MFRSGRKTIFLTVPSCGVLRFYRQNAGASRSIPLEVKESFLNVCEYERTSVLQEKANKKAYVPQYCIYIYRYIYTGICSRYTMLASIFLKVIIL